MKIYKKMYRTYTNIYYRGSLSEQGRLHALIITLLFNHHITIDTPFCPQNQPTIVYECKYVLVYTYSSFAFPFHINNGKRKLLCTASMIYESKYKGTTPEKVSLFGGLNAGSLDPVSDTSGLMFCLLFNVCFLYLTF